VLIGLCIPVQVPALMEPPGLVLHLWRDGVMASHVLPIGDFGGPFDVVTEPDYPGRKPDQA
jgi:hypothetical protein